MRTTTCLTYARRSVFGATALLLLSGCGGGDKSAQLKQQQAVNAIADFSVGEALVQAHLKANKLEPSGVRYEHSVRSLIENNALAYTIVTRSDGISPELAYRITTNRNNALIKGYLDEHVERVISEEAVEKYYNKNIKFYTKKRMKGAQIAINLHGLSTEQRDKRVLLATELSGRAREGVEFEQLVKEYSDDKKSAEQNGVIEWKTSMDDAGNPLLSTILSLNKGDISDPVEFKDRLYILKLLEEPEEEVASFEQVKAKITYQLQYNERLAELGRLKQASSEKREQDLAAFGLKEVNAPQ